VALEILDGLTGDAPDLAPFAAQLKTDIESDKQQLLALMDRLGIEQGRLRKASGWLAEQFVEAKLELDDEDKGELRRLERLEALVLGISGKLALWRALEAASLAASIEDERLRGPNYEDLVERAREQCALVESLRIQAARSALTLAA
jgi:hypothetical protein